MNFSEQIDQINKFLAGIVSETYPFTLTKSMRYSLLNGGKRLRPLLVLNTGRMLDLNTEHLMPLAAAIEMIHTYSLIHDDLPSMDNDDFRRGKPSNHKVFGEANAILAGDALLTHSFFVITELAKYFAPEAVLKVIQLTALYAGIEGMVAGQSVDVNQELLNNTLRETIEYMHLHKTAKLITLCLEAPAVLAHLPEDKIEILRSCGEQLGLAFQIQDDILDEIATTEQLGKPAHSDQKNEKLTYLNFLSIKEAQKKVENLYNSVKILLRTEFKKADALLQLIEIMEQRQK